MDFGRAPARGDRRRRVLTEELLAASADDQRDDPGRRKSRPAGQCLRYSEAAVRPARARLTDVVPQRPMAVFALLLLLASSVAVIVALDASLFPRGAPDSPAAAMGVRPAENLAAWFASSVLLLSGCAALIVFTVRRHRMDDYHARYRIWLWAAAGCLLMSVEAAGGVLAPACDLLTRTTGWHGTGQWAWIAPIVVLAVFVGLRLLLEVKECRVALACLLLAGVGPIMEATAPSDMVTWGGAVDVGVAGGGIAMAACACLLLGFLLYARHVVLEADGRMVATSSKGSAALEQKAVRTSASRRASSPPTTDRPQAGRRAASGLNPDDSAEDGPPRGGTSRRSAAVQGRVTRWTDGSDGGDETYDDDDQPQRRKQKISKSERKRLRKLKQQVRRAA